jgi:hypothetical protein
VVTPEWILGSGELVVDRPDGSHIHDLLETYLPEVFRKVNASGRSRFGEEVNLGRVVGSTTCVTTSAEDVIRYARRVNRLGHTRFVLNREAERCSTVFVAFEKVEDEPKYVLLTAYVGHRSEVEPWDTTATDTSRHFWDRHALLWGTEPIDEDSVTSVCPW